MQSITAFRVRLLRFWPRLQGSYDLYSRQRDVPERRWLVRGFSETYYQRLTKISSLWRSLKVIHEYTGSIITAQQLTVLIRGNPFMTSHKHAWSDSEANLTLRLNSWNLSTVCSLLLLDAHWSVPRTVTLFLERARSLTRVIEYHPISMPDLNCNRINIDLAGDDQVSSKNQVGLHFTRGNLLLIGQYL